MQYAMDVCAACSCMREVDRAGRVGHVAPIYDVIRRVYVQRDYKEYIFPLVCGKGEGRARRGYIRNYS